MHAALWIVLASCRLPFAVPVLHGQEQTTLLAEARKAVGWPSAACEGTEIVFPLEPDARAVPLPDGGHQPWLASPTVVATADCTALLGEGRFETEDWDELHRGDLSAGAALLLRRPWQGRYLYALGYRNSHRRCFTLGALLLRRPSLKPLEGGFWKSVTLDSGFELTVAGRETDDELDVRVALLWEGGVLQQTRVEGAGVRDELIRHARLDRAEKKSYVITAFDWGSTYGAQTTLVAWDCGTGWRMKRLHLQRGIVRDADGDGIFEIVETYPQEKVYRFTDGRLVDR